MASTNFNLLITNISCVISDKPHYACESIARFLDSVMRM